MFWFRKPAVVELEAPQSDADPLAEAKQERKAATAAYRAACQNAPDPRGRRPVEYDTGKVNYIQTPKGSAAEQASDRAVREADARFHAACRRVAMLEFPGLIL
jgi:hypothetical protein